MKEKVNNMILNIEKTLSSDILKNTIKYFWDKTHSLYVASIFIGEVFTYYFINKDYDGFSEYLENIKNLYDKTIDFNKYDYLKLKKMYKNISNIFDEIILDTEEFKMERAKIICKSIMKKLGLNKQIDELTKEEKILIKDTFIKEYIYDGFVIHSFHSSLKNSIIKNGLSSNIRIWDDDEVVKMGKLFLKKGAAGALGGYTYYNGEGLYFEHNYRKLYSHAIYSPEWFNFLTSANHLTGFPDIDRAPFVLRNYDACKRNVIDLCCNVGMDSSDIEEIIDTFNNYFDMFKSPKTAVAIIPKAVVNKNSINNEVIKNKNMLETIIYLIDDINEEYKEHFGNVWIGEIPFEKFHIIDLPELDTFIHINNFARETKEELFELTAVEHMKRHLARILNSIGQTKEADELLKEYGNDDKN